MSTPSEAIAAAINAAKHYDTPPAWMWGRADSAELLAAWSKERERLARPWRSSQGYIADSDP